MGGRQSDIVLLVVTLMLVGIGTVMVFSSSMAIVRNPSFYLKQHLIRVGLGIMAMLVAMRIDYRFLKKLSKPSIALGFGLLITVILMKFLGITQDVRGAYRAIHLKFISFQPSEFTKVALVVYLADLLSRKQDKLDDFTHGYLPPLIVTGLSCLLITLQPDLGTAVTIATIALVIFFVSGIRFAYLLGTVLLALPFLYMAVVVKGYRRDRIMAFLNPSRDTQGIAYQINQSLLAIGSGGLFGVGLGRGKQKFLFLPEPHTDFVFSVIGEELGFIGALSVMALFLIFIWRGMRAAKRAPDLYGFLLGVGLTSMIGIYALFNIAVVTGVFPTTGLPLPFLSYGGSSLLMALFSVGVLLNISGQSREPG